MPLSTQSTQQCGQKYDPNPGAPQPSCQDSLWQLGTSTRVQYVARGSCGNWTRQWSGATYLGCSEHAIIQHYETRGICSKLYLHIVAPAQALAGLAFVDDTNLIFNDASNLTDMVKSKMQCSFMMWHGLLMATGGNLVPDKCF